MPDEQELAGRGRRRLKELDPRIFNRVTPRVKELTVDDLNQLAQFATAGGQAPPNLADIDAQDLRSLEDAFHEARLQASDQLGTKLDPSGVAAEDEEIFDGWSCCCCTPCCCCAAADVDPFA